MASPFANKIGTVMKSKKGTSKMSLEMINIKRNPIDIVSTKNKMKLVKMICGVCKVIMPKQMSIHVISFERTSQLAPQEEGVSFGSIFLISLMNDFPNLHQLLCYIFRNMSSGRTFTSMLIMNAVNNVSMNSSGICPITNSLITDKLPSEK